MYVGIETSSTALNVAILDRGGERVDAFAVDRFEYAAHDRTAVDLVGDRVDPREVDLAAMAFAWGDDLSAITDIGAAENYGNRGTPGFRRKRVDAGIYDAVADGPFPTVLIPGVNDRLECLHPYFRHYAQLSGPDKVADARYAREVARERGDPGRSFVSANASSSTRAVAVSDGELRGAFHFLGLVHGWPDGDTYASIMSGEVDPQVAVERSGLLYKPGKGRAEWSVPAEYEGDENARQRTVQDDLRAAADDPELLELVHWATLHNVYSMVPFVEHDGEEPLERILISGRLARVESPFDVRGRLEASLSTLAPTEVLPEYSAALGAAHVARDVAGGADEVLGIPVSEPGIGR